MRTERSQHGTSMMQKVPLPEHPSALLPGDDGGGEVSRRDIDADV